MNWRNVTEKDLNKVVKKLSLEMKKKKGRSKHPVYWYSIDGKKSLRITFPNAHGNASISTGFLKQIRMSFRLDTKQFKDLVECPLTAEKYKEIIEEKGI